MTDITPKDQPVNAYNEGFDAYLEGQVITNNPYPSNTRSHNLWLDGWKDAAQDNLDVEST